MGPIRAGELNRFSVVVKQIVGKRRTYQELIGKLKDGETSIN
ncbi:MAG: hypothetical protein U0R19_26905 [Bryobacteraceae bacterium]